MKATPELREVGAEATTAKVAEIEVWTKKILEHLALNMDLVGLLSQILKALEERETSMLRKC